MASGTPISFDSLVRPRKSEAARAMLSGAAFDGTRSQRAWLIMVDGRKSLRELAAPARALGLGEADLQRLVDGGWLEFPRAIAPPVETTGRGDPAAVPTARVPSRPAAPFPAAVASAVSAASTAMAPVASPARPAAPAGPPRSWAAAKMYAMDLVRVMLPAHQRELVEMARTATDGDELRAWLQIVAAELTVRAGAERAQLFVDKVRQVMPLEAEANEASDVKPR